MDELKKEITELTESWYRLISKDHHKDKDFHWYVNTVWSYGQEPIYRVEHFGYLLEDVAIECKTYEEALLKLRDFLKIAVEREKEMEYYEL